MPTLFLLLTIAFGTPDAAFRARVSDALARLCPCSDAPCLLAHSRVVRAVAIVAGEARDRDGAAALLIGLCVHESRCVEERQANGGKAITPWQLEVRAADRAALLADDVAAARLALARAQTCGGSLRGYAWGRCEPGSVEQEASAAGLRAAVRSARWALDAAR